MQGGENKVETETNPKRLSIVGNKLRAAGGKGAGDVTSAGCRTPLVNQ